MRKTKTIRKRRTNKKKIRILGGLSIADGIINLNIDDLFNKNKTETKFQQPNKVLQKKYSQ